MKADFHTHSIYSFDGSESLDAIVQSAIKKGLTAIAITDHLDLSIDLKPSISRPLLIEYYNEAKALKEKYKDNINLIVGIEIGYRKNLTDELLRIIDGLDFELVINSVHDIDEYDLFIEPFYIKNNKQQAYDKYLNTILDSLNAPYNYDIVGHIGYVERKAVYKDVKIYYNDHKDTLNEIFDTIMQKHKFLEINTNCYGLDHFIPNPELVQAFINRCKQKNYKLPDCYLSKYSLTKDAPILFGSDAHRVERIMDGYQKVIDLLNE